MKIFRFIDGNVMANIKRERAALKYNVLCFFGLPVEMSVGLANYVCNFF